MAFYSLCITVYCIELQLLLVQYSEVQCSAVGCIAVYARQYSTIQLFVKCVFCSTLQCSIKKKAMTSVQYCKDNLVQCNKCIIVDYTKVVQCSVK